MAAQVGYCGLDRQRQPLTGDEIRPCWEAADAAAAAIPALPGIGPVWPLAPADDRTTVRPLQFVEVQPGSTPGVGADAAPSRGDAAPEPEVDPLFVASASGAETRWSLWGEPES